MPRSLAPRRVLAGIRVEVVCRQGCRRLPSRRIVRTVRRVFHAMGVRRGGVTLLFTGNREMRSLNRKFRGQDRPTDVLSFPSGERGHDRKYLGDIAISVEEAGKYAREVGWRLSEELEFLLIHGVLHLLGHDHEIDGGEMDRVQARLAWRILGREIPVGRVLTRIRKRSRKGRRRATTGRKR